MRRLESTDYPSVINMRVEVCADECEGGTSYDGAYLQVTGRIVREIQDGNGGKYFIIELENRRLTHRYLMVTEKCVGDSIPMEFSRGEGPLHVGIAVVLNDRIVANDTFDFDEVHYFAIGEIRPIR